MKKYFNVSKIVLALLLVMGSQESVQGQFGMGGFIVEWEECKVVYQERM